MAPIGESKSKIANGVLVPRLTRLLRIGRSIPTRSWSFVRDDDVFLVARLREHVLHPVATTLRADRMSLKEFLRVKEAPSALFVQTASEAIRIARLDNHQLGPNNTSPTIHKKRGCRELSR